MTKSELITVLAEKYRELPLGEVENGVKRIIESMVLALSKGERIEIRGFGSFSLRYRASRVARNPKTGQSVTLAGKYVPHFRSGKELRLRVNQKSA